MNISINENFEQYRREFWKGLTLKQTLYAAAGVAVGISSYCVTTFALGIPLEVSTWIALSQSTGAIAIFRSIRSIRVFRLRYRCTTRTAFVLSVILSSILSASI